MSRNELMVKIAAAITTLDETNGASESTLYLGLCNMNMAEWEILRGVLVDSGNVVIKGNYVTLTAHGKLTAEKLNQALKKN